MIPFARTSLCHAPPPQHLRSFHFIICSSSRPPAYFTSPLPETLSPSLLFFSAAFDPHCPKICSTLLANLLRNVNRLVHPRLATPPFFARFCPCVLYLWLPSDFFPPCQYCTKPALPSPIGSLFPLNLGSQRLFPGSFTAASFLHRI